MLQQMLSVGKRIKIKMEMLPILIVLKFLNMVQLEVEFHYESSAQVTTVELTISNQTCLQYMKTWDLFRKNALISETYICIQSQKLFPMLAKNAKRSLHNQSHTMVCFITGSRDEPKRSRMMIGGLSNQLYLKNFVQKHSQLITTIKLDGLIFGQKSAWQLLNENIIGQECIKKLMITYNHVKGVKRFSTYKIGFRRINQ